VKRPVLVAAIGSVAALLLMVARPTLARAEPRLSDTEILGVKDDALRIVSTSMRVTAFEQQGSGYQSKNGPLGGPGSERVTVLEPQLEIVATQGERVTHRLWVPLDVVSAASPDGMKRYDSNPPDMPAGASRHVGSGSIDWMTTYKVDARTSVFMRSGFHLEDPFRSYNAALGATRSFADDNTTIAVSINEVFDWFDRFDIEGNRHGRAVRNSINGNLGVTQLLSPTTVVHADYGLTLQQGELGNTWNAVPFAPVDGVSSYGPEVLPDIRLRHALLGKIAQSLPWNGALKGSYRFYADDWGIVAHTLEAQLYQRILPTLWVRASYRFHHQSGASFFTIAAPADDTTQLRTADSDLQTLDAHTLGFKVGMDFRDRRLQISHIDAGYERYFRTNDLQVNIVTCAISFRF
jgi:hypothetical protein